MTGVWTKKPGAEKPLSSRRWQLLRARILQREPLCRPCSTANPPRVTLATEVDRIVLRAAGGDVFDESNLQPICRECHRSKSLRERGYSVPVQIGADGYPVESG